MPNCAKCSYYVKNSSIIDKRSAKGVLKGGKEYCQHPDVKQKVISLRAKGKYDYPFWCPLSEARTCILCGTRIHQEEGDYCKNCR